MNETPLFSDPKIKPNSENLAAALGKNHKLFAEFEEKTSGQGLVLEWNYYNDGKSWLCKILHKKKNLGWLWVENKGFKITFYIPEKAINGVYQLDIDEDIKNAAKEMKPIGKTHPVVLSIKTKKIMNDAMKILEYKRNL